MLLLGLDCSVWFLQMVHRLFSIDIVMVLLEQPERSLEECQDSELAGFLPHKFLIQDLLFARRMDTASTVQGHALSCLAQCLELPSLNVTRAVHNLFSASEKTHTDTSNCIKTKKQMFEVWGGGGLDLINVSKS